MGDAAMTTNVQGSAIVLGREAEGEFRRSLEPSDIQQAHKVATALAAAGLYGVRGPEDALARIMTGRELGLSCMQSMRGLYNVENKIGIDASLMHALCLQSSLCEMFECTFESDEKVEYTIKRRGWGAAKKITWTIADATRAGLIGRGSDEKAQKANNWNKYPKQMMHARCKADGARQVFPEKLFGLYTAQELYDGAIIDIGSQSSKPANDQQEPAVAANDVNAAPSTDALDALQKKFITYIEDARTDADKSNVRMAFRAAVDAGQIRGPWEDAVRNAYNAKWPPKQAARAGAKVPPPPASDAPSVTTQGIPIPEGARSDFERATTEPPPPAEG